MTDERAKRTWVCICQLKNIGPQSSAPIKFLLETAPLHENDDGELITLGSGDWIITGQVFPRSTIYANQPVPIKIVIGKDFPAKPPTVFSRTLLFHPNIDDKGEICDDLLKQSGTWSMISTLNQVIEVVTGLLDEPLTDNVMNDEAVKLFDSNRMDYENRATQTFRRNRTITNE